MRFTDHQEINNTLVLDYIKEAIENQRLGRELLPARQKKPLIIPEELKRVFHSNSELKITFNSLSLSNKRLYCDYISAAKRTETKAKRLEKITPMILNGKYR